MNYVADRLAEKTSGAVGDAVGTYVGSSLAPISTLTGLLSPTETRLAVPEGGEAAVPVSHMDDTAREAGRRARRLSGLLSALGGAGAGALVAVPALAAGGPLGLAALPALSALVGGGTGVLTGQVFGPMASRTKTRLLGRPYLREEKPQTFKGEEVEKESCLSVTAPGIADRLYAKTSGAYGDAVLSVLGAPAALPAAMLSAGDPVRDKATGQILMDETAEQGREVGQLVGGGAGAVYGAKNYVTGTPRGPINRLLGRKPGLYSTLARTALLGGLGMGLGGVAGAAGSRSGTRLIGNYRRKSGEAPAPIYEGADYNYDYSGEE